MDASKRRDDDHLKRGPDGRALVDAEVADLPQPVTVETKWSVRLPAEPASAKGARRLVREALTATGRSEYLHAAELAATELVTNAVLHAHTDMDLSINVDHVVRVEVRDFSPALPMERHYGLGASTGRGLGLVAAVTDAHGVTDAGPDGKTMWFEVGAPHSADPVAESHKGHWSPEDGSHPEPGPSSTLRPVRLLHLPPTLWLAARQHHDRILRELAFFLDSYGSVDVDLVATDRARLAISNAVVSVVDADAHPRGDEEIPSSGGAGHLPMAPEPLDLEVAIPPGLSPDVSTLQETLDTAERLAITGQLLCSPGLPEVVALRRWACGQIIDQLADRPPTPWSDTAHGGFSRDTDPAAGEIFEHAATGVRDASMHMLAVDDDDRVVAVSATLAATLGWHPDHLIGRRGASLAPRRLRNAYVAAFTMHLQGSPPGDLGNPVTLPVLGADGTEITMLVTLKKLNPLPGRALYVAVLVPDSRHHRAAGR